MVSKQISLHGTYNHRLSPDIHVLAITSRSKSGNFYDIFLKLVFISFSKTFQNAISEKSLYLAPIRYQARCWTWTIDNGKYNNYSNMHFVSGRNKECQSL